MSDIFLNENKWPKSIKFTLDQNKQLLTFQFIGTRNKSKYQIYENVFAKYAIKYFKKLSNENKLMDSFNNSWDQLEIRIEKQNFEEFRFIFNEMYRLKLIIKKGDNINLWHYTTQDKFLNIIKKREIWFRNINFHNDSNEKNGLTYFGFDKDEIKKIFSTLNAYTFSTTNFYDDLGMWVLYLTGISYETYSFPFFIFDGETNKSAHHKCLSIKNMGVCFSVNKFYLISFLFQKIEGDFNFASIQDDNFIFSRKTGFCKINYESQTWNEFISKVNEDISLHRRMYKAKCFDEDRIKILASLSHKNNWYRFEQEYRFVILENKKKNDSPKEFYHLENLDIKQLINSVYVSPYCKKCFCNMNCQKECCISKMINMCEINNIEIKPSTIQFQSYNPFSLAKGGE